MQTQHWMLDRLPSFKLHYSGIFIPQSNNMEKKTDNIKFSTNKCRLI